VPLRVAAQELEVPDTDRVPPADRTDYAWHGIRVAAAVQGTARIVEVDAFEGRSEAIRVALAADLAVSDVIESGILLRLDRRDGRIVLRLREIQLGNAP